MKKTLLLILLGLLVATSSYAACGDGTTTNYDLCKPSDADTDWGDSYRDTMDAIDTQMKANADDIDTNDTATGLNTTHRGDNTQAHSDYLLNTSDSMSGNLDIVGYIASESTICDSTGCIGGAEQNNLEAIVTGIADDEIPIGSAASDSVYTAIPDCNVAGSALAYEDSTNTISCRSGFAGGVGDLLADGTVPMTDPWVTDIDITGDVSVSGTLTSNDVTMTNDLHIGGVDSTAPIFMDESNETIKAVAGFVTGNNTDTNRCPVTVDLLAGNQTICWDDINNEWDFSAPVNVSGTGQSAFT